MSVQEVLFIVAIANPFIDCLAQDAHDFSITVLVSELSYYFVEYLVLGLGELIACDIR